MKWGGRLHDYFYHQLWQVDVATLSPLRRIGIEVLRVVFVLAREMWKGDLTLRAMSLVYTTLLSFAPMLAVSFSVLKAFDVHNQVQPLLDNLLAPLGPQGFELSERIIGFVSNMKVGVLGTIGLLFLFFTVISLIEKIEESFNYVWRVRSPRSFARRFSDYLSVVIVGPVLVFSAMGITATLTNSTLVQRLLQLEALGPVLVAVGFILPFVIVSAAFTFIYIFIPNTRVHFRSALVGGTVAGVLWEATGMAFASFVAGSTKYAAIYSGFAIILFFMIWLYISWVILLFGSQVAYYHQHPQQIRQGSGRFTLSPRLREHTGLLVLYLITERYMHGAEPWTADALVLRTKLPGEAIDEVLEVLVRRHFLVPTGPEGAAGYVPARDPATVGVHDVLAALRTAEEDHYAVEAFRLDVPAVATVIEQGYSELRRSLGDLTLKELVTAAPRQVLPFP